MNPSQLEVLFSPAEFAALQTRDLGGTICVVFDILRATTSIVTALFNDAAAVIPVETIERAVALKQGDPGLLLAGERHGLRIEGFDFGNSPREFTRASVAGRTIAMTTTNGTRGLRSCVGANEVLAAGFLNQAATASYLRKRDTRGTMLICSGTYEEASYEDTLAAGAMVDALWSGFQPEEVADSAQIARNIFLSASSDLLGAMRFARNGRRLLEMAELAADVPFCLQRDTAPIVASLASGKVIRIG